MNEKVWHKHYDRGVPSGIEPWDRSLPDFLERAANQFPNATATVFLNSRLTYRELKDQVDRLAAALMALDVIADSRVAIHLPNIPQTVIATMAVLSLRAQTVMTNPLYVPRELEHQWNDAGCTVAITADYLFKQVIHPIRERLTVKHYIVTSIPEYLRFPLRQLAPLKLRRAKPPLTASIPWEPDVHPFRALLRVTPPCPARPVIRMEDVAALQYTGGTTGVCKGAMLTHGNLSRNVQQLVAWFPDLRDGREVFLACLPYFHIFGLTVSMLLPICKAAAMILVPNPRDMDMMVKSIVKHRVTLFSGVPAMFNAIGNYRGVEGMDMRSIRTCFSGSAPLAPEVLQRFERLTGGTILEGFGLTESSPVTHCNPIQGTRKIGSIGIPIPGTDAKIVDPADSARELTVGQEGELAVKGPQIMKGYWGMPDETSHVLRDGWLYTGDLAVMDEDGYFRIVGRKKDMILASGYNVYPDEIDRVLMTHEAVLEACSIGIPDPKRGETVKSFVVLRPGMDISPEDIIAFCREQLAVYKVPGQVEIREELPKSSMMKVLRRVLREEEIKKRPE